MSESQNIEYKESWNDEYLKWVCGFANAQGGKIYIGLDDSGNVIGLKNVKKLMESIPNKIKDTLGIMADVNKKTKSKKEYIEIVVRPSSYPVNYDGEYHYRSGATKQQLRGAALTEFLMEKTGRHWEAVPVDRISIDDLDDQSFKIFRREAQKRGRMSADDLDVSNAELLDRLNLLVDGRLTRAAVLLFYDHPERVFTGSHIKVGRFGDGSDLQYQDDIDGSVIRIADRAIDLIYEKYLKAAISYEHDRRVETYPFPREGVREAIYNALVHNCYGDNIHIQIRIEDEAMYISNQCRMPKNWTEKTLMGKHRSIPYNPLMANVFFRSGYIESWGRGVQKICEACKRHGSPEPSYEILGDSITIQFKAHKNSIRTSDVQKDVQKKVRMESTAISDIEKKVMEMVHLHPDITMSGLADQMGVSYKTIQRAMSNLRQSGMVDRIGGKRYGRWVLR